MKEIQVLRCTYSQEYTVYLQSEYTVRITDKIQICLKQGRTESLGNDDISSLNACKYEMGNDDVEHEKLKFF